VFKEGGAFEFYNTYTALLDRLQTMQGDEVPEHLEDLPVYSTTGAIAAPEPEPAPEEVPVEQPGAEGTEDVPDELPPAYDQVTSDDEGRGRLRTRY
jgi:hypothetical protein